MDIAIDLDIIVGSTAGDKPTANGGSFNGSQTAVTVSLPLRRGGRNSTVGGPTVLGRRRMTIAVLTLLVFLLGGSDAAGASLSVEILNRTTLDTGDYSLAIETDQFGIIFLTGKFLSKTTAGEKIVDDVLLDVSFEDKTGSVIAMSTVVVRQSQLGRPYSSPVGRMAPAPNGVNVSSLARVVLTVHELTTQEALDREQREREKQRQAGILAHAWPKPIETAVLERRVLPGMTAEQVTLAWGKPQRVNQTLRSSRISEQWVYSVSSYVYFENGRVTAIQTGR